LGRALTALAESQKSECASGEARGRGGLGPLTFSGSVPPVQAMDTDHDGTVSLEEMQAFIHGH